MHSEHVLLINCTYLSYNFTVYWSKKYLFVITLDDKAIQNYTNKSATAE